MKLFRHGLIVILIATLLHCLPAHAIDQEGVTRPVFCDFGPRANIVQVPFGDLLGVGRTSNFLALTASTEDEVQIAAEMNGFSFPNFQDCQLVFAETGNTRPFTRIQFCFIDPTSLAVVSETFQLTELDINKFQGTEIFIATIVASQFHIPVVQAKNATLFHVQVLIDSGDDPRGLTIGRLTATRNSLTSTINPKPLLCDAFLKCNQTIRQRADLRKARAKQRVELRKQRHR